MSTRTCTQCGGVNLGGLPHCILCGARMTDAAARLPNHPEPTFCGECGTALEPGLTFCGECGTPTGAAQVQQPPAPRTEPASQWAPHSPRQAPAPAAQPSRPEPSPAARVVKFCPKCGKAVTPGKPFCRHCGYDFTTRKSAPPPPAPPPAYTEKQRPAAPPAAREPAPPPAATTPSGPSAGQRAAKKALGVVIPVASMIATYYLTNRFAGAEIAQKMNLPPQLVPMLISMAVGGIARQIMK